MANAPTAIATMTGTTAPASRPRRLLAALDMKRVPSR
jgi:hypothetical protein